MPIATTQDLKQNLTVHVVTDRVTEQEMFGTLEAFYAGQFTRLLLWDMSQANLEHVSIDTLRRFVHRAAELGADRVGGKTAVVAATALQYGLARMSATFADIEAAPYEFAIFKTCEEARAWLTSDVKSDVLQFNRDRE